MKSKNINVTIIWKNNIVKTFDCNKVEFIENSIFITIKNGEKRYVNIDDIKHCTIDIEGS